MRFISFCDIVNLAYDGGYMKKKNYILYLLTFMLANAPLVVEAYGRTTKQSNESPDGVGFFALLYLSPIIAIALISLYYYLNRAHERTKDNVEDRNLTGAHAALDVRNVKDREFMQYIEETEDKTDLYLSEYFNNITDLK